MKKLLFTLAGFLLVACAAAPDDYTPRVFSFTGNPIRVNVQQIKLADNYRPPLRAPNIEQDFPTPPAKAVNQWVLDRLQAAGTQGVLEITIDDASAREEKLPVNKDFSSLFTDPQTSKVSLRLHVTMRLYNGTDPLSVAGGDITVTRSRTLDEKASVVEREQTFDTMIGEMMQDFDQQAQSRLHQYFGAYLL